MNLRWTDAGRAALASSDHTGTAAVKLTHFAIGDGQGPGGAADDSRAALRNERHRAAIEGTAPADGRIALRADFAPDASYGVTEAGVFGTAGDPSGPLTLLLYWSDGGAESGKAAANTALTFAVVVEFQSAAADVAVTVGGNIVFGATEPATEEAFGSTRYATGEETGAGASGERAVTPKGLKGGMLKLLGALVAGGAGDGTVYQLKGDENGALVVEERTQDGASKAGIAANVAAIVALADRVAAVEGKTGDAATNAKGIVELATDGEAKTGTDARRAVTPKAMRAATAANVASLLDSAPEEGKQYVLEGLAAGGLKLVLSTVLVLASTVTLRSQVLEEWGYSEELDDDELVGSGLRIESVKGGGLPLTEGSWLISAWCFDARPSHRFSGVYASVDATESGATTSLVPSSGILSGVYPFTESPAVRGGLRNAIAAFRSVPAGGKTMHARLVGNGSIVAEGTNLGQGNGPADRIVAGAITETEVELTIAALKISA